MAHCFDIREHNSYINSSFRLKTEHSAAWLAHYLGVVGVAGSNPAVPTRLSSHNQPFEERSASSWTMHYWVSILRNRSTGKFYIGQTLNLQARLVQHNNKRSKFTSSGVPWTLIYRESYPSRNAAIRKEQFLKSPRGWHVLQQIKHEIYRNNFQELSTASFRN
jgi:putative endonuclease